VLHVEKPKQSATQDCRVAVDVARRTWIVCTRKPGGVRSQLNSWPQLCLALIVPSLSNSRHRRLTAKHLGTLLLDMSRTLQSTQKSIVLVSSGRLKSTSRYKIAHLLTGSRALDSWKNWSFPVSSGAQTSKAFQTINHPSTGSCQVPLST
jgi:hypothetical protein